MHTNLSRASNHAIRKVCIAPGRIILAAAELLAGSCTLYYDVEYIFRSNLPKGNSPHLFPHSCGFPPPQPVTGPASRANSYARTMGPLHLGESFWRRRPAPASVGMPLTTTPVEDQLVAMLSTQDAYTPVRCARMRMRAIASAAATPLEFAFGAPSPGRSRPGSAGADGDGPSADASSDISIPHEEWRGKICEWCYR